MANILITGGNRGIGLNLIKQLSERGDTLTVLCRKSSDALDATDARIITGVDMTDCDSIKTAQLGLKDAQFDILINNAGILSDETLTAMNTDAFERMRLQFEINTLGPLKVTTSFLPQLNTNGKIVLITSRMGSISDNESGGRYGYRMSKAALNAAGKSLSIDLKDSGIAVGIFHPGWVQTEMTGNTGPVTPIESAAGLIKRIDELNLENTGSFFHMNGEALPW